MCVCVRNTLTHQIKGRSQCTILHYIARSEMLKIYVHTCTCNIMILKVCIYQIKTLLFEASCLYVHVAISYYHELYVYYY